MLTEHKNNLFPECLSESYTTEVERLFNNLELSALGYLGEGTINNAWLIEDKDGSSKILVVGPELKGPDLLSKMDSGYLDERKFIKAQDVTSAANNIGIPATGFLMSGVVVNKNIKFGWGLERVANGTPLTGLWKEFSPSQKNFISNQIGDFVAKYQKINSLNSLTSVNRADLWYQKRVFDLLKDGLGIGVFNQNEADNITLCFNRVMDSLRINNTIGLIHGDLFQPNVFVEKEEDRYKVTGIIDWETAILGHIGYEQVLSAWWFAGEQGGSKEIFESFINSSSEGGSHLGFERQDLQKAIYFVDMFWHLNVIVSCAALNRMTDVPRWLGKMETFISLAESPEAYADLS